MSVRFLFRGSSRRTEQLRILLVLSLLLAAIFVPSFGWIIRPAHGQIAVRNQGYVPFSEPPINYRTGDLNDPVTRLKKQIELGEAGLQYEPRNGYLKSVLQQLNISPTSQTLVFSKTSFQYKKISPKTPRATYFNDDVYIGWVNDGKALEAVSFDPMQGAVFYLLDAHKADHPNFQRAELDCTQCHIAPGTRGVPGVLVRSIFPSRTGTQVSESVSFITGQESPLKDRWGGWYVTGKAGHQLHMGNAMVLDSDHPETLDRSTNANATDLARFFDTAPYLTGNSDIVAHLVLDHQTQMHNLITLTNYKTRLALYDEAAKNKAAGLPAGTLSDSARRQYERPAEELLRYLLFVNEAPLDSRVKGTSGFAQYFAAQGPRDPRGRSLRDFNLRTRIFKYPCSYLIYSESFDSLPDPAKSYIYHRLFDILTGRDQSPDFARLKGKERQAIFEILLATKPGLPAEWKAYPKQAHLAEQHPGQNRPGQ